MEILKKISSVFLVLFMSLSVVCGTVYADVYVPTNIYTIMDFSLGLPNDLNIEDNNGAVSVNTNPGYTYNDAPTSLKIDFSKLSSVLKLQILLKNTNFKHHVNANYLIRMRAFVENGTYKKGDGSTATSLVNFVFTQNGNLVRGNPYYRIQRYPVNKDKDGVNKDGEWIEIAIPLQECTISGDATWSHIEGFEFNIGGWTTGDASYGAPTQLYIDSIWLEGPEIMFWAGDDGYIVKDINTPLALSTNTENTAENKRLFDMTTRMHIFPAGKTSRIRTNPAESIDTTGYNYLNIWAYLPEPSEDSVLNVCVYKFGQNEYYRHQLPADWSGWKLISLDKDEDFKATELGDWSDVGDVGIFANQWAHDSGTFKTNTYLDVDMIWFSKEKPKLFGLISDSTTEILIDEPVEISFSKKLSYLRSDVVIVEKDGKAIDLGYNVSIKDNKLILTFDEDLDYETLYKVKINNKLFDIDGQSLMTVDGLEPVDFEDKEFTFTTESKGSFRVKEVIFKDNYKEIKAMPLSGTLTSTVDVRNSSDEKGGVILILAVYDDTHKIVRVTSSNYAEIATNSSTTMTASLEMDSYNGCYAKAFVWNGIEALQPYIQHAELKQ